MVSNQSRVCIKSLYQRLNSNKTTDSCYLIVISRRFRLEIKIVRHAGDFKHLQSISGRKFLVEIFFSKKFIAF